ncbi:a disintegrin and metalloproteinase with thrombospondin motifs 2 [Sarotherodon galilaeus]
MEDDPSFASTNGSAECTVADGTDGFNPAHKKEVQSRGLPRLQKLRRHHSVCEQRYERAHSKRLNDQRERTLFLHRSLNTKMEQQLSSDSDSTIIIKPTSADSDMDTSVPELRRTDSVILTRQMLGCPSISSSDISEEEYAPQTAEESDSSAESIIRHKSKKKKARKTTSANSQEDVRQLKRRCTLTQSNSSNSNAKESSSLDPEDTNTSASFDDTRESSSPDCSDVTVMTLRKKKHGGRLYNKKFYCKFCCKPFSKMARHLQSKHKDKPEVAKAMAFPVGSKERKIQLSLLRNQGNRAHNNEVIKKGQGMLIPRQQSSVPVKASDYLHCINCQGYFKRRSLWRHMQRCHLSRKVRGLRPGTSRVQAPCKYAEPVPDSVNAQFWKLVQVMHDDEITNVVRKESCILKFGEHLFNKHGHDVTKHDYIRQKMRETGRLVLQGQKNGKLKMVSDFFVPGNFPHVIAAVKNVAGLNEETNTYKTPSLALKLGHNLKKIADVLECEAMIAGDENTIRNVKVFKQICDTKWSECISSKALRNLSEAKWNTPQLLPFTEDVKKMHQYLNIRRTECHTKLKEEPNKKHWAELAKITLCEVIIFNRRREGEVSKMILNAFTLRDTSLTHPDVELALTDLEKKLCRHFQRIEIKGKRGRKVPILLTPDMMTSMDLLVNTRRDCEVLDENPFMFARPKALTHIRGSDVVRQIAQSCGAKQPEALSSTKLRKHMATMSKILNLKDNEMDNLADFLGHDIRVHREYYRLPEGTLQLAKISKVLMAMERGQLSDFKGRNLDEIIIDPQENVAVDSDASNSEDEDNTSVTDAASSAASSASLLSTKSSDKSRMKKNSTTEVGQNKYPQSDKGMSDEEMPPNIEVCVESHKITGASQTTRRKWTEAEIKAVEKTLMEYISSGKVPGKAECLKCIETSPLALKERRWEGVKFYVKNRIDALKRESVKRR